MKKYLAFFAIAVILLSVSSCGYKAAKKAFSDGTVTKGSTYEEVINAAGKPQREYDNGYEMMLTYVTVLTGGQMLVILEKEDGVYRVTGFSDDDVEIVGLSMDVNRKEKARKQANE